MAKKLERVGDITGRLFDHPAPDTKTDAIFPKCQICGNWGYTDCPQAKAPNGGDYVVTAFREGTACSCPAGAEFAKNQMEWMKGNE